MGDLEKMRLRASQRDFFQASSQKWGCISKTWLTVDSLRSGSGPFMGERTRSPVYRTGGPLMVAKEKANC